MPVIPAAGELKQEDGAEFKISMAYVARSSLKNKTKQSAQLLVIIHPKSISLNQGAERFPIFKVPKGF